MVPIYFSEIQIELISKTKKESITLNKVTKGFTIEECSKRLHSLIANEFEKNGNQMIIKKIRHLKRLSSGVND